MQDLHEYIKPLLPREEGTILETQACWVSLSPGKNNKTTLFYFLQTVSVCLLGISEQGAKTLVTDPME